MAITGIYAGALAFLYLVLSYRVVLARRSERVEIGMGESGLVMRRARVHGNFAEYAPFVLVLMGIAESLAAPAVLLHVIGVTLAFGRVVHAYGLSNKNLKLRVAGMMATFTSLSVAGGCCLVLGLLKSLG